MHYLIYFLSLLPVFCTAQKHDYIWVFGRQNDEFPVYGGSILDFNGDTAQAYVNHRNMDFYTPNVSMADKNGNLLFYSNGCAIAGADDAIMDNGDGINPGVAHQEGCVNLDHLQAYVSGIQSMLSVPQPESTERYYMFHQRSFVSVSQMLIYNDALLYSVVDMAANNGKGRVEQKNTIILETPVHFGQLVATKHGNGKDWWVITPEFNGNTYYSFLLTKDGIKDTMVQVIGDRTSPSRQGFDQAFMASDGSYIVRFNALEPIQIRYFDRSTGLFTGYDTISVDYQGLNHWEAGCVVSPNSRFVYITTKNRVYQFDMWATDISASQTTVGIFDGFADPIGITFDRCALGPDCKIYIMGAGDTEYFHVIHSPDEKGLACNLEMRGLILPLTKAPTLPFHPNYRLGPIDNPGVPCTPTVSINTPSPLPALSVFPNPASEQVTIKINHILPDDTVWRLYDALGRLVRVVPISHTGAAQAEVWVADLPSGLYFYEARGGGGLVLWSGSLVVE